MTLRVPKAFFDQLADAAAQESLKYFRSTLSVETKSNDRFDPVTIADKASERAMRSLIAAHYPDHGILGEEEAPTNLDATHLWVLDPIDGTRAFICGLPVWGVLIGHYIDGRAEMGMMRQPFTRESYFGDSDGALYEGPEGRKVLSTRPCAALDDAVLMCTSPHVFSEPERGCFGAIEQQVRMARYGTDCYGYCMLARGLADAVIETGLEPYDVAALIPIVEAAGGRMTTWRGDRPEAGGQIVASGDARLHDLLLAKLQDAAL